MFRRSPVTEHSTKLRLREEPHGDDGLGGAALQQHEDHSGSHSQSDKAHKRQTAPGNKRAAPGHGQHERGHGHGHGHHAGPIEGVLSEGTGVAGQRESEYHHGKQGHGHREPEDPAPARHLDEPAAHKRAQHIRHGEHGADDAHVGAEFARRHHVGERRLGQDDEATAPEAGDEVAADEHLHVHGQAAHHLARGVQRERRHEQPLAADKVAQLAVDGHDQRRRQDVGSGDPLHDLHAVQVAHDGGQRRGGDGLGKRADEHGEQKPEEHERQRPAVQGVIGMGRGSACGFCGRR